MGKDVTRELEELEGLLGRCRTEASYLHRRDTRYRRTRLRSLLLEARVAITELRRELSERKT